MSSSLNRSLTVPGFRKIGSYYIGRCNSDIISGYCLEVTINVAYVWRFILPAYDKLESLHLALGDRFSRVQLKSADPEPRQAVTREMLSDWESLSRMMDRRALLADIDERGVSGIYPIWVRFLTQIRDRNYIDAESTLRGLDEARQFSKLPVIAENYKRLTEVRRLAGWEGCSEMLTRWSKETNDLYA
jgi:hypothetical protein